MLKLALPNKGRLAEPATRLLQRAGLHLDFDHERKLLATTREGDMQVLFVRAQDIPEFVADGTAHVGITGLDQVQESGEKVEVLLPLGFGRCRLVLAVPESSSVQATVDMPKGARVATSFPRVAAEFFRERGNAIDLIRVSGATEITPHLGVADAVVDLVSTGSTMVVNKLRPVETVLESEATLIGDPNAMADDALGARVDELRWALSSVLEAARNRYLMANLPSDQVEAAREILPGIAAPTILDLLDREEMVALHAVVPEDQVHAIVRGLKELGATGVLVTPIERLVP